MNRRAIGTLVALVLAAAGTFVLLTYVRTAEDRAMAGEEIVEVLMVAKAVPEGTAAEALRPLVTVEKIAAKMRAADSIANLDALEGKVAAVDLVPGEQVLSTRFVDPEVLAAKGDIEVPDDVHEVTVSLDPQRALGGQIMAGDKVGVLASFDPFEGRDPPGDEPPLKTPNSTHMILHKVLVTKVQGVGPVTSTDPNSQATAGITGNFLITLALEAPAVERVVFAAEHGFVWLTNEHEKASESGTRIQTRGTVYLP